MTEHLAWGGAQGGLGGRPWGATHARMRATHLAWWRRNLSVSTVQALQGCLPAAESALRGLQRAGKTRSNYAESLRAFCLWCVERRYLDTDPLKNLRPFDRVPQTQRRSLTSDEVERLLQAAPARRRLLYQTALVTGLRALELRHLTLQHLDLEKNGLHLEAAWTKNRKSGFQPLPAWLADALHDAASHGEADDLYTLHYGPDNRPVSHPSLPLVYVPLHPTRPFHKDCLAASIPLETEAGKAVFHSLRITFVNRIIAAGATLKEAQALARHASPEMTFNVYGRTEHTRMAETVESASAELNFFSACVTCVSTELPQAVGGNSITQQYQQDSMHEDSGRNAGSNPAFSIPPAACHPRLARYAMTPAAISLPSSDSESPRSPRNTSSFASPIGPTGL